MLRACIVVRDRYLNAGLLLGTLLGASGCAQLIGADRLSLGDASALTVGTGDAAVDATLPDGGFDARNDAPFDTGGDATADAAVDGGDGAKDGGLDAPGDAQSAETGPVVTVTSILAAPVGNWAGLNPLCIFLSDGRVRCWGAPSTGELGVSPASADQFVTVPLGADAAADATPLAFAYATQSMSVDGGPAFPMQTSCFVEPGSGRVLCAGDNSSQQLGRGGDASFSGSLQPVIMQDGAGSLTNVAWLAGGGTGFCAVANGSVFCWGSNYFGATGDAGAAAVLQDAPVLQGASQVVMGQDFSCALNDGAVFCWGDPDYVAFDGDQHSGGPFPPRPYPPLDHGVTTIRGAFGALCALRAGNLFCTDGDGGMQPVPGLADDGGTTDFAMSNDGTCSIYGADANVYCWGQSVSDVKIPGVPPARLEGVSQVTVGSGFGCALTGAKQIYCWGDGSPTALDGGTNPNNVARLLDPARYLP